MRDDSGCTGCRFLCKTDQGYSNYTVTGQTVECLRGVNPHMPADSEGPLREFDVALDFGTTCAARSAGDPVWFDCDGEVRAADYAEDAEVYDLLLRAGYRP